MRNYAMISPLFWIDETGKKLRRAGEGVQLVALYLMTCPAANMLGLYYLALPTLCHEVGKDKEEVSKALKILSDLGFAHYDAESEYVWIPEMARIQIGQTLKVGQRLKAGDKQRVGIERELQQIRSKKLVNLFLERYADDFNLEIETESDRHGGFNGGEDTPSEGVANLAEPLSKPHRRGTNNSAKPIRSKEQEQENYQEQEQEQEFIMKGECEGETNFKNGGSNPRKKPPQKRGPHSSFTKSRTGHPVIDMNQDVISWMEKTGRESGKRWTYSKDKRKNQGPTPGMEAEIQEKDRTDGPFFRPAWLDYLQTDSARTERYPYRNFLEGFWQRRLSELAEAQGAVEHAANMARWKAKAQIGELPEEG
ncbi:MAG: hypothetical protein HYX72_12800 [Acidobacteria bacterium]|nr:hypothetical protein [Acidobacteriota bacterium]